MPHTAIEVPATQLQPLFMKPGIEIVDAAELAARLKVKTSWVVQESKPSRTHDPIPVFRLGKHRRYRWGSPELDAWLSRRLEGAPVYNEPRKKRGAERPQ
jgi:hypothetical protein